MGSIGVARLEDGSFLVDLRGWMCPYPKYMLDPLLGKMGAKGRLVLLVDCPSAATDVPELARARGCRVPEVRQVAGGEWQITIEVGQGPKVRNQQ